MGGGECLCQRERIKEREQKTGKRGKRRENRHGENIKKKAMQQCTKPPSEDWDGQPDSEFAKIRKWVINHSTFKC